ncbi:DASH complex subunit spc19 [Fusarium solani]
MAAANLATYSDCVSSLRTSLKFLESSVETLDNGVSDFPRLVNVLKTVRIERQERRIETLKARAELQQGRLARPDDDFDAKPKRGRRLRQPQAHRRREAPRPGRPAEEGGPEVRR